MCPADHFATPAAAAEVALKNPTAGPTVTHAAGAAESAGTSAAATTAVIEAAKTTPPTSPTSSTATRTSIISAAGGHEEYVVLVVIFSKDRAAQLFLTLYSFLLSLDLLQPCQLQQCHEEQELIKKRCFGVQIHLSVHVIYKASSKEFAAAYELVSTCLSFLLHSAARIRSQCGYPCCCPYTVPDLCFHLEGSAEQSSGIHHHEISDIYRGERDCSYSSSIHNNRAHSSFASVSSDRVKGDTSSSGLPQEKSHFLEFSKKPKNSFKHLLLQLFSNSRDTETGVPFLKTQPFTHVLFMVDDCVWLLPSLPHRNKQNHHHHNPPKSQQHHQNHPHCTHHQTHQHHHQHHLHPHKTHQQQHHHNQSHSYCHHHHHHNQSHFYYCHHHHHNQSHFYYCHHHHHNQSHSYCHHLQDDKHQLHHNYHQHPHQQPHHHSHQQETEQLIGSCVVLADRHRLSLHETKEHEREVVTHTGSETLLLFEAVMLLQQRADVLLVSPRLHLGIEYSHPAARVIPCLSTCTWPVDPTTTATSLNASSVASASAAQASPTAAVARNERLSNKNSAFLGLKSRSRFLLIERGRCEGDFNMPFDVSCSLYRFSDVQAVLKTIEAVEPEALSHPNSLEVAGCRCFAKCAFSSFAGNEKQPQPEKQQVPLLQQIRPLIGFPQLPTAVILTVNRVQTLYANPVYVRPSVGVFDHSDFSQKQRRGRRRHDYRPRQLPNLDSLGSQNPETSPQRPEHQKAKEADRQNAQSSQGFLQTELFQVQFRRAEEDKGGGGVGDGVFAWGCEALQRRFCGAARSWLKRAQQLQETPPETKEKEQQKFQTRADGAELLRLQRRPSDVFSSLFHDLLSRYWYPFPLPCVPPPPKPADCVSFSGHTSHPCCCFYFSSVHTPPPPEEGKRTRLCGGGGCCLFCCEGSCIRADTDSTTKTTTERKRQSSCNSLQLSPSFYPWTGCPDTNGCNFPNRKPSKSRPIIRSSSCRRSCRNSSCSVSRGSSCKSKPNSSRSSVGSGSCRERSSSSNAFNGCKGRAKSSRESSHFPLTRRRRSRTWCDDNRSTRRHNFESKRETSENSFFSSRNGVFLDDCWSSFSRKIPQQRLRFCLSSYGSIPVVSWLIPVRNAALTLATAIKSLVLQTRLPRNFCEIILIEDGSTDATPALIRALFGGQMQQLPLQESELENAEEEGVLVHAIPDEDPVEISWRILWLKRSHGVGAALQRGWTRCRGAFIARLDADDFALPHRISTQITFMQSHPSVAVCGSAFATFRWVESFGKKAEEIQFFKGREVENLVAITRPPSLEKQRSRARFAFTNTKSFSMAQLLSTEEDLQVHCMPLHPLLVRWQLLLECPVAHPTVLLRKKAFESLLFYSNDSINDFLDDPSNSCAAAAETTSNEEAQNFLKEKTRENLFFLLKKTRCPYTATEAAEDMWLWTALSFDWHIVNLPQILTCLGRHAHNKSHAQAAAMKRSSAQAVQRYILAIAAEAAPSLFITQQEPHYHRKAASSSFCYLQKVFSLLQQQKLKEHQVRLQTQAKSMQFQQTVKQSSLNHPFKVSAAKSPPSRFSFFHLVQCLRGDRIPETVDEGLAVDELLKALLEIFKAFTRRFFFQVESQKARFRCFAQLHQAKAKKAVKKVTEEAQKAPQIFSAAAPSTFEAQKTQKTHAGLPDGREQAPESEAKAPATQALAPNQKNQTKKKAPEKMKGRTLDNEINAVAFSNMEATVSTTNSGTIGATAEAAQQQMQMLNGPQVDSFQQSLQRERQHQIFAAVESSSHQQNVQSETCILQSRKNSFPERKDSAKKSTAKASPTSSYSAQQQQFTGCTAQALIMYFSRQAARLRGGLAMRRLGAYDESDLLLHWLSTGGDRASE